MSVQAQAIYRDQFVEGFELRQSVLRDTVTTDTESRGGSVFFLVASSNNRSAVTRGSNGLIPASDDLQTQVQVSFTEAHDLQKRTGFDIFRAQSNQLAIMQMNGMAVINRKMDYDIINLGLDTGTVTLGAIGAMTKTTADQLATKLRNAHVGEDNEGNLYCAVSPAAWAYLTDITSFANSLYSATGGKVEKGIPQITQMAYWMGLKWLPHTALNGLGTSACTCYSWHKAAVGHAIAAGTIDAVIDRDREQDYSFARHSLYHGVSKLQNAGIVKFVHDDSALS